MSCADVKWIAIAWKREKKNCVLVRILMRAKTQTKKLSFPILRVASYGKNAVGEMFNRLRLPEKMKEKSLCGCAHSDARQNTNKKTLFPHPARRLLQGKCRGRDVQ